MQVMESFCGDVGFEENKGRDDMDSFPIEQADCFVMEAESNIRILHDQQYLHDDRQEDAFFMTGVTRDESKDCAEPHAELSMHCSEEHTLHSQGGSTTLTAAYEEMVSIHSESASQVVVSLDVKTLDEDWNRSPRSVLMMGNSALERSRLKRCVAAKDTLRKEKSDMIDSSKLIDVRVGNHVSALPLPLPLPLPVFIPHSRRRRTSAVIIQKCIRIFLLHRMSIKKRIQGEKMQQHHCLSYLPYRIQPIALPFLSYLQKYLLGSSSVKLSFFNIFSIVAIY